MGVSPADKIVLADIHPPGISYFPVNHDYLPVVPVIEHGAQPEYGEFRVGKRDDIHTGFLHLLEISRPDVDVGDVFIDEPDLDPAGTEFDQPLRPAGLRRRRNQKRPP